MTASGVEANRESDGLVSKVPATQQTDGCLSHLSSDESVIGDWTAECESVSRVGNIGLPW